jgi:CheY-like chemotaxis protein
MQECHDGAAMRGPTLHGIKVLVVDDNPMVREMLATGLARFGATVTAEVSADVALATLTRERPDVLLSDIEMPGHDGFWLISQVRILPAHRGGETPAAAITGNALAEDRAAILSAGFQCHVPKPVDLDQLAEIVTLLALKPEPPRRAASPPP